MVSWDFLSRQALATLCSTLEGTSFDIVSIWNRQAISLAVYFSSGCLQCKSYTASDERPQFLLLLTVSLPLPATANWTRWSNIENWSMMVNHGWWWQKTAITGYPSYPWLFIVLNDGSWRSAYHKQQHQQSIRSALPGAKCCPYTPPRCKIWRPVRTGSWWDGGCHE